MFYPGFDSGFDSDEVPCNTGKNCVVTKWLRRLLGSVLPIAYKNEEEQPEETDAESIDPGTLERMVKSMKPRRRDKEDDDGLDVERLVELGERPRKLMRFRNGRKKWEGLWRKVTQGDYEEDGYSRRKRLRGEDEEAGKRWRNRRLPRRRERELEYSEEERAKKAEEERHRKTMEEEWRNVHKEDVHGRHRTPRNIFYLPPEYPQPSHILRPRSEEYLK